jgi:intracellular septation protein
MKFLFDFFPVLLFFIAFKVAGLFPEGAQALAQQWLGGLVSHGSIDKAQAPVLLATSIAVLATACQIGYLFLRRKKVDGMLWISAFVVTFFGGLTIYFNDEAFIKWKPTMIFWCSALMFALSQLLFKKNLIREMMGAQFEMPEPLWIRLLLVWIAFFISIGIINWLVAFVVFPHKDQFGSWVNFKTFVMPVITFVFVIVQGLSLSKYMKLEEEAP